MEAAQHAAAGSMPIWVQVVAFLVVLTVLTWGQVFAARRSQARDDRIEAASEAREEKLMGAVLGGLGATTDRLSHLETTVTSIGRAVDDLRADVNRRPCRYTDNCPEEPVTPLRGRKAASA